MLALEVAAQAGARGEAELTDEAAVGLLTSVDDLRGQQGEPGVRAERLAPGTESWPPAGTQGKPPARSTGPGSSCDPSPHSLRPAIVCIRLVPPASGLAVPFACYAVPTANSCSSFRSQLEHHLALPFLPCLVAQSSSPFPPL